MRGVIRLGWEEAFEVRVRLFDSHTLRAEADAAGYAVDVSIHGESGLTKRKTDHNGSRFGADTIKSRQPGFCLLYRYIRKE